MTRLGILLAPLLCAVLAGCATGGAPAPGPSTPSEIAGTWVGEVTAGAGATYDIRVTIDDTLTVGQQAATVTYPKRGGPKGCGGTWVYTGKHEGTFAFTETIASGVSKDCTGSGDVTLTPAMDDTLQYGWHSGSDSTGGLLKRGATNSGSTG